MTAGDMRRELRRLTRRHGLRPADPGPEILTRAEAVRDWKGLEIVRAQATHRLLGVVLADCGVEVPKHWDAEWWKSAAEAVLATWGGPREDHDEVGRARMAAREKAERENGQPTHFEVVRDRWGSPSLIPTYPDGGTGDPGLYVPGDPPPAD